MMVGALPAGAVGDFIGRRRLLLGPSPGSPSEWASRRWRPSVTLFGLGRFFTGIGIGALVAAAGAVVAEFAPPGKRNLYNAIVFAGYPVGGVLASVVALAILEPFGFRALFWIGALPLVTLLPLAIVKLPESPTWLLSRGRLDEARAVSGAPVCRCPTAADHVAETKGDRGGLVGLFAGSIAIATILIGFMSAGSLMLTYALNTWLPELMGRAGYSMKGSLSFLLVLNGGAIVGSLFASRFADRFGPKHVIVARSPSRPAIAVLTLALPLPVLLIFVAIAGTGHDRHAGLIYGFVSNYYADLHPGRRRRAGRPASAGSGVSRGRWSEGSCSPRA